MFEAIGGGLRVWVMLVLVLVLVLIVGQIELLTPVEVVVVFLV